MESVCIFRYWTFRSDIIKDHTPSIPAGGGGRDDIARDDFEKLNYVLNRARFFLIGVKISADAHVGLMERLIQDPLRESSAVFLRQKNQFEIDVNNTALRTTLKRVTSSYVGQRLIQIFPPVSHIISGNSHHLYRSLISINLDAIYGKK